MIIKPENDNKFIFHIRRSAENGASSKMKHVIYID